MSKPKKVTIRRKESDIQLSILHYLKAIGAVCGKTKTMGVKRGRFFCFDPYTFRGFPDLTVFYKAKLYFIEVKGEKGKQSDEQKLFEQEAIKAGITYILARDVEDVSKVLQSLH